MSPNNNREDSSVSGETACGVVRRGNVVRLAVPSGGWWLDVRVGVADADAAVVVAVDSEDS
jgi:hypothetical protein